MLFAMRAALLVALSFALANPAIKIEALRVSAHIPELVKLNDAFWLNCTSQQQQQQQQQQRKDWDDIYAIRWYKDGEEFYKFTPNGQPKVSIYETVGIQLDQTKSHEGNVYISKADVNSEGNYRCEVLSEAPIFETVGKSKQLKVFALPVRGPRIEILDSQGRPKSPKAQEISYAVGDKIELRCNSAPSKPAAKLRWYLNEHEITIPTNGNATVSGPAKHQVRVTPMEFRQHYKSIYSSHSTLSLVLQQDDLINNKISFKCLASMRQEIQPRSRQLIVLMPPSLSSSSPSSRFRRDEQQQQQQKPRPQNQRHSVTRLQQQQHQKLISGNNNLLMFDDNSNEAAATARPTQKSSSRKLLYIYEGANSALGSTIIDTLEGLEAHLQQQPQQQEIPTDNLEYIQLMREKSPSPGGRYRGSSGSSGSVGGKHKANSLVRSPFYLDENDSLRPIISWPPLEFGRLLMNNNNNRNYSDTLLVQTSPQQQLNNEADDQPVDELAFRRQMIERLMKNINCTCTDGSVDSRLNWLVNDQQLDTKDTRFYPARVSQDHRQTILTIGFSAPQHLSLSAHTLDSPPRVSGQQQSPPAKTLRSLLANYLGQSAAPVQSSPPVPTATATAIATPSSDQIRFACQATHSMLLHSSSEMITFDFNPPPSSNSIVDKFAAASSSNVIQATSASQSSSAPRSQMNKKNGSQSILLLSIFLLLTTAAINKLVYISQTRTIHKPTCIL